MSRSRRREFAVVLLPGLITLGVCVYQLTLPHVLTGVHGYSGLGYDDGVYFGAAVRLVHGAAPYRNFVLVHPPGVPLLLAPIALLGRGIGADRGLALARVVTMLVAVANAMLVAVAIRHRGRTAMLLSGLLMACFPLAVTADRTVLLEPYLVFFCLVGVILMFSGGTLAGRRRLLLAGVSFGLAATVKIWAFLVIVAVLAVCLPRWSRAVRPMATGVLVGFVTPCLPFLVLAPGGFVHDVFVDQVSRTTLGAGSLAPAQRLVQFTGLTGLTLLHASVGLALALAFVVIGGVAFVWGTARRSLQRFDVFVLLSLLTLTLAMFRARDMYDHYAYFPAAFLALLVGGALARARTFLASIKRLRWMAVPAVPGAFTVAVVAFVVPQQVAYARTYLGGAFDPAPVLQRVIPAGSCVVADQVTDIVVADRFVAHRDCPSVVDPYGTWLATYETHLPPYTGPLPQSFVLRWRRWLASADFVVLVGPQSDILPWPQAQVTWFDGRFTEVVNQAGLTIYRNNAAASSGRTPSGSADSNALVASGLAAERAGNLDQAFADYQAAQRADPNNVYAAFDVGHIYQSRGAVAAARTAYERALSIDPTFSSALYNLGVLETRSDPQAAIGYFRRDLSADPRNAAANFNLGVLLYRSDHRRAGERFIRTALSLEPSLRSDLPRGVPAPPG